MSSNLVERVNNLSDSDAVLFLQDFNQSFLGGIIGDFKTLRQGIPEEIKSMPEFSEIDRLSLDKKASIKGEEAVALSRDILVLLADNPRLSPLLEMAMDAYVNIEHLELGAKEEILSRALAAAVILLAATSVSIEGKMVNVKYEIPKEAAVPVLLAAFTKLSSPLIESIKRDR
jgi:hypothetical protein